MKLRVLRHKLTRVRKMTVGSGSTRRAPTPYPRHGHYLGHKWRVVHTGRSYRWSDGWEVHFVVFDGETHTNERSCYVDPSTPSPRSITAPFRTVQECAEAHIRDMVREEFGDYGKEIT